MSFNIYSNFSSICSKHVFLLLNFFNNYAFLIFQDLSTEICLHESQLKRLEDAWLHLHDVNDSLTNQHKEIYALWKYVTDKLTCRSKEWYVYSKRKASNNNNADFGLTDDLVYTWIREITSSIRKANELLKVFDDDCESSKLAVAAFASVAIYNFKILSMMWTTSLHSIVPQHRITDVANKLSSLKKLLKDKLNFHSPQSSDSENEEVDDVTDSPIRPVSHASRSRMNKTTRDLDLEAEKFFEQELRKFQKCLLSVRQNMGEVSLVTSEANVQKETLLYQVNILFFTINAYNSICQ